MRLTFLIAIVLLVGSCKPASRKIPDNFDYGKIENNVYKNEFFEFQQPVPASWVVQTKEQVKNMSKQTEKVFDKTSKEFREMIKASEVNSARLLTVFKYEHNDSTVSQFNPSFALLAENLKGVAAIKNGTNYLENVRTLMKQSNLPYEYDDIHETKLGNHDFAVMPVRVNTDKLQIQQYYYAIVMNGFAFCVISSSGTAEQEKEVQNIIQQIHFN